MAPQEEREGYPKLIAVIIGARPNYMKVAPVLREKERSNSALSFFVVDTEQHFDDVMRDVHFRALGLPEPDYRLNAGKNTGLKQVTYMADKIAGCLRHLSPDAVMVVGDTNSTLAGAMAARMLRLPLVHLEAGLRSFNEEMQEEANRKITDSLSDLLLMTEPSAEVNLTNEACQGERVYVGNPMIDSLQIALDAGVPSPSWNGRKKVFVTLHRPELVDDIEKLLPILGVLHDFAKDHLVLFPVHPRTRQSLGRAGFMSKLVIRPITMVPPMGYVDALAEWSTAHVVVTDSGGLQEETTALGVPCLTVRNDTERPFTVTHGTNTLVGLDPATLHDRLDSVLNSPRSESAGRGIMCNIPGWDGQAAKRILQALSEMEV